jgi:alpha-galactosidase
MNMKSLIVCLGVIGGIAGWSRAESIWVSNLDLTKAVTGWGHAQADKSIEKKPLTIAGQTYARGIGMHATGTLYIDLAGRAEAFRAKVGVDDEVTAGQGSVVFKLVGDGRVLFDSGVMKGGQPAKPVDVNLKGVNTLLLLVGDAGDNINYDHGDWAEAVIVMKEGKPSAMPAPAEQAVILTPKPGPSPRINGPKVYGCRPGNPFLYRIPCTGERPMQFTAKDLPASLKLDVQTGIITGTVPERGEYKVTLQAMNMHGRCERAFKIVAGDKLSLTPQMGFNDWYAYYDRVTEADMRFAADVLISSGMADAGYEYVNIDDCWMKKRGDEPYRDEQGRLLCNAKFPDIKGMVDYIHAKGLKAGTYISPGPWTCAGYAGSYKHEAGDAKQFADWGFDFLKFDWCSYGAIERGKRLESYQKPYRLMGDLLKQQNRDIVYNLCQYGMGDVWKWGAEVGGHSWRTGGDLGFELHRIFDIALKNCAIGQYNKPGGWNDSDYIQIGWIGNAQGMGKPRPCGLTPSEQYSFMSLWCLMASPLFYSGDMTKLDEFTLNILCNPEVIEVNQDSLGQCARVVGKPGDTFVLVKDMEDGSKAIGLCNRGEFEQVFSVNWSDLGLTGKQNVRDLWRHKNLGKFAGKFEAKVPRHGVVLVRVSPSNL